MTKPIQGFFPPSLNMSASEIRLHNINQWTEKQFQDNVIDLAKQLGYDLIYHTHDSRRSQPGFPDLVLINSRTGRTLWRELKSAKGRIRKEQQIWIDGLKAAGHDAEFWRPEDWFSERIKNELLGKVVA